MQKYYIPEINLRDLRNKNDLIQKMKDKFNSTINKNSIIISTDGYYKYEKDKLIKYKIIDKETIVKKFSEKYTIIGINSFHKKVGEVYNIPYENSHIIVEKITFNIGTSSNYLVFELINNKIRDMYFLSRKKIDEDDKFFTNDVSSFVEMLI
tara:strand:- start:1376 stop:1831 length:456 start_codon:yes stop_codon:yes gene_type:complete